MSRKVSESRAKPTEGDSEGATKAGSIRLSVLIHLPLYEALQRRVEERQTSLSEVMRQVMMDGLGEDGPRDGPKGPRLRLAAGDVPWPEWMASALDECSVLSGLSIEAVVRILVGKHLAEELTSYRAESERQSGATRSKAKP